MQNRAYDDAYTLRLPDGWRDAIKARAAVNRRSMNQEILAALEGVVGAAAAGQGVQSSPAAAGIETAALERGVPFTTGIGGAHDECPHG